MKRKKSDFSLFFVLKCLFWCAETVILSGACELYSKQWVLWNTVMVTAVREIKRRVVIHRKTTATVIQILTVMLASVLERTAHKMPHKEIVA